MADNIEAVGLELDTRAYERALLRAERRINSLEDEFDDLTRKGKRQQDMFSGLEKRVIAFAGAYLGLRQAARIGRAIFETNVELEQLEARLTSITGSTEKAEAAFDLITRFASDTPFEIQNLTEAFTTLQAAGIEPTEGMMRDLGNFAAAMGRDITDLVQAILRASQGGTERLRESFFIPISKEGDKLKISFRGMSETIEADSESLIEHFRQLAETNFADGMERQMLTMGGAISNLEDSTTLLIKKIGDAGLNGEINELIRTLDQAIQDGDDFAEVLGQNLAMGVGLATDALEAFIRHQETIIAGFQLLISLGVGAVLGRVTTRLLAMAAAAEGAATAAALLRAAMATLGGPAGLIIAAGTALFLLAERADTTSEATRGLRDRIDELTESLSQLTEEQIAGRFADFQAQMVALDAMIAQRQADLESAAAEAPEGGPGGRHFSTEQSARQAQLRATIEDLRGQKEIIDQAMQDLILVAAGREGPGGGDTDDRDRPPGGATPDALQRVIESLEEERVKLQEGERALLAYQLAKEGVSQAGIEQALALFDQVEAIEAEQEARETAEETTRRQEEAIRTTIESLEEQNIRLRRGEEGLLRHQLRAEGATEAQIEMAVAVLRSNNALEAQIEAEEDAERRRETRLSDLERTSESIAMAMGDAFFDAFDDVEDAAGEMVDAILRELSRLVITQGITEPLAGAILDFLLPIAGAAGGGGGGGGATPVTGSTPRVPGRQGSPVGSGALVVQITQHLSFPSLDAPHVAEMLDRHKGAVASATIEALRDSESARQALMGP